jgi:hypothetical protein
VTLTHEALGPSSCLRSFFDWPQEQALSYFSTAAWYENSAGGMYWPLSHMHARSLEGAWIKIFSTVH